MTLTEFLAARLDETGAAAWAVHDVTKCDALLYEEDMAAAAARGTCDCGYPARVLREAAAMRAILGRYASQPANLGDQLQRGQEQMGLLYALEQLAAIWDDHPDYEGEWRP